MWREKIEHFLTGDFKKAVIRQEDGSFADMFREERRAVLISNHQLEPEDFDTMITACEGLGFDVHVAQVVDPVVVAWLLEVGFTQQTATTFFKRGGASGD